MSADVWPGPLDACKSAGIMIPHNVVVVDFDNHESNKNTEVKLKKIVEYFTVNYILYVK